jgi:NAD-dependent dihydropyrimidine dehydrogenase PreA subunit
MPPVIDDAKCIQCGDCVDVCPVDVYYGSKEGETPVVSYGEDCFFCSSCILECQTDAILLRYPLYAQPSYLTDEQIK